MTLLVRREFAKWRDDQSDYLGLPYDLEHYTRECPPLLFIGGKDINSEVPCLVVLSLEPLLNCRTFSAQKEFVLHDRSHDGSNYLSWQFDYFRKFPVITGALKLTPYWRTMTSLVCGWCKHQCDPANLASWDLLAANLIEIPLVPMHAKKHPKHELSKCAKTLLFERLAAVKKACSSIAILALGDDCVKVAQEAMGLASGGTPVSLEDYQPTFGKTRRNYEREIKFLAPSHDHPAIYLRTAPFANGHQPSRFGIAAIGRSIRKHFESVGGNSSAILAK